MSKNLIIWVEDRSITVEELIDLCRKQGFEVRVVATAHRLAEILQKEEARICLFVVDIMLFNIMSLENIRIPDSLTENGYSAGWVLIDRFLRPIQSSPEMPVGYPDIPIIILSSRPMNVEDKDKLEDFRQRRGAWIEYIEKNRNDYSAKSTYTQKFAGLIKKIAH